MSALELTEVRQILDDADARPGARKSRDRTSEDDLRTALQALFMHQCVYSDAPLSGRPYDIVLRHRVFFEKYLAAMDFELVIDRRDGIAAMRPRGPVYGWKQNRLKKDETLVLLGLRYLFEHGMKRGEMTEQGRIETSTDELYDAIKTLARTEPPAESRLEEILKFARRKGLVRIGERDRVEKITPLVVLPGIRYLVPDLHVEAVIHWIEDGAVDAYADFFDYLQDHLAGASSNEDADGAADDGAAGATDPLAEMEPEIDPLDAGPDETDPGAAGAEAERD
jgi:hypothetical protein